MGSSTLSSDSASVVVMSDKNCQNGMCPREPVPAACKTDVCDTMAPKAEPLPCTTGCAQPTVLCPKTKTANCQQSCCKTATTSRKGFIAAYVIWFIIAFIIFYLIFSCFKPRWLCHKCEHDDHHHEGDHDGEDPKIDYGAVIALSLICALFSLIILQIFFWAAGW
jgi:hypothetical protein